MSTLRRYLEKPILTDLKEKMVFLGGPRQVGKTTFVQNLTQKKGSQVYLNWDSYLDRERILKQDWSGSTQRLIFDEIHKFARWRGLIKGYYDKLKNSHQFLVTGSARLDHYRKSGDSLLGRYHYYRMHPLSPQELGDIKSLPSLLKFGGFPEPFLKNDETSLRRWHKQRQERLIYEDVRDLEQIKEISLLQLLVESLAERVGSPLSRKNLSQSLEVDFKTVERWITILENVYYCFRIPPFGAPKIKAVKKEQKIYLWDWSEHQDEGKRWENFIGSQLLKFCHYREDTLGHKMELRFLRDIVGREVDFVVLQDKRPLFAVECKTGEKKASPHLKYFSERTLIPHFYQVHLGTLYKQVEDKISVVPFAEFSKKVGLV